MTNEIEPWRNTCGDPLAQDRVVATAVAQRTAWKGAHFFFPKAMKWRVSIEVTTQKNMIKKKILNGESWSIMKPSTYQIPSGNLTVCYWKWPFKIYREFSHDKTGGFPVRFLFYVDQAGYWECHHPNWRFVIFLIGKPSINGPSIPWLFKISTLWPSLSSGHGSFGSFSPGRRGAGPDLWTASEQRKNRSSSNLSIMIVACSNN